MLPDTLVKEPGEQRVHVVELTVKEKVPRGHREQLEMGDAVYAGLGEIAYDPASHSNMQDGRTGRRILSITKPGPPLPP